MYFTTIKKNGMSQGAQARVSLGTVTKFQLLAACWLIAIRRVRWPRSGLLSPHCLIWRRKAGQGCTIKAMVINVDTLSSRKPVPLSLPFVLSYPLSR